MIELRPDHWAHEEDLRRTPRGRPDPPEMVERCIEYFRARRTTKVRDRSHRIAGLLRSAKVRTAASRVGDDLRVEVVSLRKKVRQRDEAIDRLLAYVKRRASAVPETRLAEIASTLAARAEELFGPGRYTPVVTSETDPDTSAAHRLVLSANPSRIDPEAWADAAFQLHRYAADLLSLEERKAIRVIVIPKAE